MRLIDAEPIEKFIEDGLNNPDKLKAFGHDAIEILSEIHFASTIDPASLRPKGEWITEENGVVVCSNCGEEHEWIEYRASFCEECGADMRAEGSPPYGEGE